MPTSFFSDYVDWAKREGILPPETLKSKGRRIVKPHGEREWKCSCCGRKFLYSSDAKCP